MRFFAALLALCIVPAAAACDRACLNGAVDAYLQALVARDPGRLRLSYDFRYTENGIVLRPGEALWRTATGIGRYRLHAADPRTGQAGFIGTMYENGHPVLLALRLKLANGWLHEAESLVVRSPRAAERLERLATPHPDWKERLPQPARREELVAQVNAYLNGVEQDDSRTVNFAQDCERLENGLQTTHNDNLGWSNFGGGALDPGDRSTALYRLGCTEQLDTGMYGFISEARARRFPLVDETRGIVMAAFIFVHPGDRLSIDAPGVGELRYPPTLTRPFDTLLLELFKIEGGRIRRIEAVFHSGPYGLSSGWAH